MRLLINFKIEQVIQQSNLWTKVMPKKIFDDLIAFCASKESAYALSLDQSNLTPGFTNWA